MVLVEPSHIGVGDAEVVPAVGVPAQAGAAVIFIV
jgi:hypothetical protein